MNDTLSEPVRLLLREHMTTFERLAALMLLSGNGTKDWSAQQASEDLRIQLALARDALAGLEASGLAERSADGATFRLAPATPALAEAVDALAVAFREQRAAVMSAMSVYAIERIRSGPMRAFADAFVLGKGKDDG